MPADIPTNSRATQQQEHHPKGINRPPNTSTLNHNRQQQTCPFDKQSHHPSHCNIFIESFLQAKRRLVQKHNLCLNCLGSHFVKDCPSRIPCTKCQRIHHTALHDDSIQARKRSSKSISQNQFSPQQQPNQTSLGASQATPSLPHTKLNSILITVPVTLEFNNKFVSTYAFLDKGSSCS